MKYRKSNRRRPMPAHELFEDDLQTAKEIFGKSGRYKHDRKLQQLCRQVQRTISLSLAECGDDRLRDLLVESVTPAPDASRLMVSVLPSSSDVHPINVGEISLRLARIAGWLRHEVALAITRKRAPELLFRVIGTREVQP